MGSPVHGLVRLARSAVLAVVVVGLSAVAHVLGGGARPGVLPLAALLVPAVAACLVLTRWWLSPPALVVVLGAGQVLLHAAFAALEPVPASMRASMPGMGHGGGADMSMLAAHAATTVALALVLADAERALWRLWAWLVPLVALVLVRLAAAPSRGTSPRGADDVRPHDAVLLGAVPRRGPPVLLPG